MQLTFLPVCHIDLFYKEYKELRPDSNGEVKFQLTFFSSAYLQQSSQVLPLEGVVSTNLPTVSTKLDLASFKKFQPVLVPGKKLSGQFAVGSYSIKRQDGSDNYGTWFRLLNLVPC